MMNNPFMGMKTPQQYQSELDAMQQRYTQQYNQFNNQQPIISCYGWKYQESDNEIESLQVPANGNPFMLVGNGIFYIKKFVNGQSYISAYSFQPINNVGEPQKQPKQDDLGAILNKLDNLCDRIEKIERRTENEPDTNIASN